MSKNTVVFHTVNERTRQDCMKMIDDGELYKVTVEKLSPGKVRTIQQNSAIHLYCDMLSSAYNDKELDKAIVLSKQFSKPWTMQEVKDDCWRVIQVAYGFDKSTTKLEPGQVTKVYNRLNKHSRENFDIDIEFPSQESMRQKYVYSEYN